MEGLKLMEQRAAIVTNGGTVEPLVRNEKPVKPPALDEYRSSSNPCTMDMECSSSYHTWGCPALKGKR